MCLVPRARKSPMTLREHNRAVQEEGEMLTVDARDPPQADVRPAPGWASAVWTAYDAALTALGCAVAATVGCMAGTAMVSLFGDESTAEFELGLFGSGILLGVGLCLGAAVGVV